MILKQKDFSSKLLIFEQEISKLDEFIINNDNVVVDSDTLCNFIRPADEFSKQ